MPVVKITVNTFSVVLKVFQYKKNTTDCRFYTFGCKITEKYHPPLNKHSVILHPRFRVRISVYKCVNFSIWITKKGTVSQNCFLFLLLFSFFLSKIKLSVKGYYFVTVPCFTHSLFLAGFIFNGICVFTYGRRLASILPVCRPFSYGNSI